jgi:hypothetical protein
MIAETSSILPFRTTSELFTTYLDNYSWDEQLQAPLDTVAGHRVEISSANKELGGISSQWVRGRSAGACFLEQLKIIDKQGRLVGSIVR